ncbi:Efflux pump periplasmic linker BepF [Maioricimonas rarisocia]|uniref:Efflux pump periplasmic linker BepF n=2 Tax=Maioricimonas rarisocia TaxID=2528026 RepID=A0A517Z0D7_9PLAN|nr:Efflux pump periplasmic linker BepF [Maioricimonas rarisocia]
MGWSLSAVLVVVVSGCQQSSNEYQPPPPPKVTVATPVVQTVTQFVEENGETEAVERAEVRARVRGFLEEIRFQPAQTVQKGDVLYVIEQDEYIAAQSAARAALTAAEAAIEVADASIKNADVEVTRSNLEYERQKSLFDQDATTKSDFERAVANRDAAVAALNSAQASRSAALADRDKAQAQLEQADLDFGYTEVQAPISGQITRTLIKQGNLVESGSHLATIVARDPIYANFSISDRQALRLQEARLEGTTPSERADFDLTEIPVYLGRELDQGYPFAGNLNYIDQEGVDQETGTLALRAIFDNPDERLLAGLFVRIRVPVGELEDAVLLPEKAVSRDQVGTFVLVVNGEDVVQRREITTGARYGDMIVIATGLEASERVVLEGVQRARPGNPVTATNVTLSPVEMPAMDAPPEASPEAADAEDSASESDDAAAEAAPTERESAETAARPSDAS